MATFEAKVYKLKIEEHPNADALELAVVGDYRSIVRKGQFKTGDLGVYIPEAAVCPDWLIRELGLEGRLAGKKHNRVKAVKLRGILSQGLIYPIDHSGKVPTIKFDASEVTPSCPYGILPVKEGDDVTDLLGITKYEPPIPVHMAGEVFNAFGKTVKYDIENIKRYPDVLEEGEQVLMTEKIHGTWCCFGYHPDVEHPIVTSKGLSEKGLALKFNEANKNNLYIQAFNDTIDATEDDIVTRARKKKMFGDLEPFYILGEVFGKSIQDSGWYDKEQHRYRVFDIYVGQPGQGRYLAPHELGMACLMLGVVTVPVLYVGPFSKDVMEEHTNGLETVSGQELNIREGIVIKPLEERRDEELGRVILKNVSEAYLLRKDGKEYN